MARKSNSLSYRTHYDLLFFAHRDSIPRAHSSPNQNQSHSHFGEIGHGDFFALGSGALLAHLMDFNRTEAWGRFLPISYPRAEWV